MKIGGNEVSGPAEEVLVLPRSNGDIVFTAQAVLDMSDFEALCPTPQAPGIQMAGDTKSKPNLNDPGYLAQMSDFSTKRWSFIAIKSLEPTEIEWDSVDYEDPGTWINWETDLKNAGFTQVEIDRVTVCIMRANCLDDAMLERARASFLAGQKGAR